MMALERKILNSDLQDRLRSGQWKAANIRLMERALSPGRKVVEIGAGLGYCTQVISSRIMPGGLLVSFEPNPTLYQIALQRSEHLRHTIILPVGVGLTHGHARIEGPADEPWRCSLIADPNGGIVMHSLVDDVLTEKNGFDAIVMDAEGAEHELLCSIDVAEHGISTVISEIHGTDEDVTTLVDHMRERGWNLEARTSRDSWDNVCVWWQR